MQVAIMMRSIVILLVSVGGCMGAFFNATIGPYAICDTKAANIESVIQECYDRCRKPPQPKHSYKITVHQSDIRNGGPIVVECKKITMEQTFTKTWLFSTMASEPRLTSIPSTETECRETIAKMCPSKDCNVREPHNLDGEYHYASDTVVTKTFITAVSMPSSLTTDGPTIQVMPLSSEKSFPMSAGTGTSSVGLYVWQEKDLGDKCPFLPAAKYGCDYYDNRPEDKHFVCARGGFTLTIKRYLKDAYPKCDGLVLSSEGIIYNYSDSDNLNQWSQRIGLTNTQYKAEDTESFRSKMNHVLSNMDADMCMMQCEMLSLEARMRRDSAKLLKIGSYMILLEPNGTGVACKPAYGCRLAKPYVMCGGPPRLGLECTGSSGFWNPLLPYMSLSEGCAMPRPSEKMTFTAGHHQYTLDDDLIALVPSGFMHGRSHDLFSSDHMEGMQFERETLDELRATWSNKKNKGSTETMESSSETKIAAPSWTLNILHWPGQIAHYLAHQFKEVAVFVAVILILFASSVLIGRSLRASRPIQLSAQAVPLMEIPRESQPAVRWI
ncbi:TPA_asm: G [Arctium alphacytorhabdovirus 1]|nr:TPA_asm: G [Arctium alphacytorhabdovirus 1]